MIFVDVASLCDVPTEEPKYADMGDHSLDPDAKFLQQRQVVPLDRVGAYSIDAATGLTAKVLNNPDVTDARYTISRPSDSADDADLPR
jgi:hypothetical protein